MRTHKIKELIVLMVWVLLESVVLADASGVSLSFQDKWSNLFAGGDAVQTIHVNANNNVSGRLTWHLSAAGRTIQRGEQVVAINDADFEVKVDLQIPEVKQGVVQKAELIVGFSEDNGIPVSISKKLWFFPDNPFFERTEWLKSLEIQLFDPEKTTGEWLDAMGVPFTSVGNIDSFNTLEGMLVVGEGVSFKEYRGLGASIVEAAQAGVSVLCFAPVTGEIQLPGLGELPQEGLPPSMISFHGNDIITQLDKRLDMYSWKGNGKINSGAIAVEGQRGSVSAVFSEEDGGWSWIEVSYKRGNMLKDKSMLIVSNFNIVKNWKTSPTPGFLFAKMLEYVSAENTTKKEE